ALSQVREARSDLATPRRDLREARRSGDERRISAATRAYLAERDTLEEARAHVRWHDARVAADRVAFRLEQTRLARAKARLEYQQAVLLSEKNSWFFAGPRAFERQVARMDRRVKARESDLPIEIRRAT